MASCCVNCSLLRLPGIADFEHQPIVSRGINFERYCYISEGSTILPISPDGEISAQGPFLAGAQLCGQCDFCTLIFEALTRRYGAAILASVLEPGRGDEKESSTHKVSLTLKLSKLSFHPSTGHSDVHGQATKEKYISFALFQGALDIIFEARDALSRQNMDIDLPLEIFRDKEQRALGLDSGVCRRELSREVLSDENVQKIKGWLDDCAGRHAACLYATEGMGGRNVQLAPTGESISLPTRLLYVGNPLAGEDPRVVLPNDELKGIAVEADEVRYLALSYCWGPVDESPPNLVSNVSNIKDWMRAIPWAILPQTFQDVIILARTLGIYYVWIDSLCIIQGPGGDWQEESGTMRTVFSNAFLTVIAAASPSPHSGFLGRVRSPSCKITPWGSTPSYSLRYRPGPKWRGTDRMAEISGHRWITRGWTYQEERLARRVLQFGENKFFFDCRERERSEDTDIWFPRPLWSRVVYGPVRNISTEREPATTRQWAKLNFDHWQWLCTQYSHRRLTIPEDKLPAFSGVAAVVAAKTMSRYLAGLWESNLMHDLLWDATGNARKSLAYLGPSWSWVSLDSAIYWSVPRTCMGDTCQLHCQVLHAETVLTGPNRFGAISSAQLKLEGRIIRVKLARNTEQALGGHRWNVLHQSRSLAEAKLDRHDSILDGGVGVPDAWALLLSTCGTDHSTTRGLLLEKSEAKAGLGLFERIGTFAIFGRTVTESELTLSSWRKQATEIIILE
jgi:hypothetical protein